MPVNWHLLLTCHYRCRFCFNPKNKLAYGGSHPLCNDYKASTNLIKELASLGTDKLTFTGGEPLYCRNLGKLLAATKDYGMTTMIITNGYLLARSYGVKFLEKYGSFIDWIGLSVDSNNSKKEALLGRGYGRHVEDILEATENIRNYASHVKIKLNTVITRLTWKDDMSTLLDKIKPHRWKVFGLKIVEEANDDQRILDLVPEPWMIESFINRHRKYNPVIETDKDMTSSYFMIFPDGKFYIDIPGKGYQLLGNIEEACSNPLFSTIKQRVKKRGGIYNWSRISYAPRC
jgi:radical S-adenosyl methionine domain-containing protein 2